MTFGGLLFASCSSNRTFNANVKGVSQINIEGVKAFASLSQASSGKKDTRAGNGNGSYLYAVDEYNNIYVSAYVDVPRGCCWTVGVRNISDIPVNVQNANLIVDRVA